MSGRRATIFAGILFAGAWMACGDDFDALFAGGGSADGSADSGTDAEDRGGNVDGGGSGDASRDTGAPDGATNCPVGGSTCICGIGDTCNASCNVDGECSGKGSRNSKLTYECSEHVDKCNVVCDHANCDLRCDAEGTCTMSCGEDSTCVLRCTGRPTSCNLACNDGVKKECDGGVFTCSPTCP